MRNITVSVDDDTYRLSRIRAAELDTSVSALVRGYLQGLVSNRGDGSGGHVLVTETERERRRRLLSEVFEDIRATRGGFKASDNLAREAVYDRNAIR